VRAKTMFRLVARVGALALAMLMVIGVRPSLAATWVTEEALPAGDCSPTYGTACGEYTLTNNSSVSSVFGFVVGNSFTSDAAVIPDLAPLWSAAVINETDWNAGGVQLVMHITPSGPDVTLLDSSSLGSWDTYFGSDTSANAYWITADGIGAFLPLEEGGGFLWQPFLLASNYIILGGSAPNDILAAGTIGQVPVPASLPLFVSGLGALGFFGWRKRRASAA
jgi:hypothetical protein